MICAYCFAFLVWLGEATGGLAVPDDLAADMFPPGYAAGARIFSNSWGGSYWYDGYAIQVDNFLYDHPDAVIFFAAGNDGGLGKDTVLSPGLSKNAIAVAALLVDRAGVERASFSARGPAPDGRFKPDIAGPGSSITSARARGEDSENYAETCELESMGGTSMATPVCAGNSALIKQYFDDSQFWRRYCDRLHALCATTVPWTLSGALLKGAVLHSGSSDAPDFSFGFGRLTLTNLLPLKSYPQSNFSLYIDQFELQSFQAVSYKATVLGQRSRMMVTLSWYDPPNVVFSSKALLHDLDLVVKTPSGRIVFGNNDYRLDQHFRDELNNVEKVIIPIDYLEIGDYTVTVQSRLLTESPAQR